MHAFFLLVVFISALAPAPATSATTNCSNFQGLDACVGNQTEYPPTIESRRWQTPSKDSADWQPQYQDQSCLVGHAHVVYTSDHASANVTLLALTADPSATVTCAFDGSSQFGPCSASFNSKFTKPLQIQAKSSSGCSLLLDPVDFLWNNPLLPDQPAFQGGQRGAIVELFGWPYKDIAMECDALGKMGYMAVKVFPPQESVFSDAWPQNNELNPWWFMYQPVSYRLHGRHGSRDDLRAMIRSCRSAGVRVYADAVINHMTGSGNDIQDHRNPQGSSCALWGAKNSTAGSPYFTAGYTFDYNPHTQQRPAQEFPSVPYMPTPIHRQRLQSHRCCRYGPSDFHCDRVLGDWSSGFSLNYGWLVGLADLNTGKDSVRARIADYLTDLLGIGFSGFRIDAAKHVQPDDLAAILGLFKENFGGKVPDDWQTYLEVIIGGEKELLECEYQYYDYALYFSDAMAKAGLVQADIDKVKIWQSDYPKEFPVCGYWPLPPTRFAIQNDCADDQNPGSSSRDMGDKGSVLLKDKNVALHRSFEQQLFTRNDGNWSTRIVLSSYTFMANGAQGIPDGLSDCSRCTGSQCTGCKSVPFTPAHDPSACGYTVGNATSAWAEGVYTRVHRDRSIIMAMRQWLGLPTNVTNAQIGLPDACV